MPPIRFLYNFQHPPVAKNITDKETDNKLIEQYPNRLPLMGA